MPATKRKSTAKKSTPEFKAYKLGHEQGYKRGYFDCENGR